MTALLLVGTGLIGGSFALAARRASLFDRVIGIDYDQEMLSHAIESGVIDEGLPDGIMPPPENIAAVCLGVPVSAIAAWVQRVADCVDDDTPIFDVGSVKSAVVREVSPPRPNFVPCHPIAGSEKQGPLNASADLFVGQKIIVTPLPETREAIVSQVESYWQRVGATTQRESAESHDRKLAVTSHLPHLLAFAMMELVKEADAEQHVGNGFKDFTRLADSDPDIWANILAGNREELEANVERLIELTREIGALTADLDALRERIASARRGRERLS